MLGVIGPVASFWFVLPGAARVFHLDHQHLPAYVLSDAICRGTFDVLPRTRARPFWSIRPPKIVWVAVVGTQIIASIHRSLWIPDAAPRLGLGRVRVGLRVGVLSGDRNPLKLLAYHIFDPVKAEAKPEAKEESKTGAKVESQLAIDVSNPRLRGWIAGDSGSAFVGIDLLVE